MVLNPRPQLSLIILDMQLACNCKVIESNQFYIDTKLEYIGCQTRARPKLQSTAEQKAHVREMTKILWRNTKREREKARSSVHASVHNEA